MPVTSDNKTEIVESTNSEIVVSTTKESVVIESGGTTTALVESAKETTIVTEQNSTDVVESCCVVRVENSTGTGSAMHLEAEFTFSDVGSPILLGLAPFEGRVQNTFLEIINPFDAGLQVTIGTAASVALLMRADENIPEKAGHYETLNNVKYDERPELFLFFNTANPTTGSARATIYFN